MKTLLIDDCRNLNVDVVAKTFSSGLELIRSYQWDEIYLDHDLGDPDPRHTGYDLLCFMESSPEYLPKKIILVTSNPVGIQKMNVVINRLKEKGLLE